MLINYKYHIYLLGNYDMLKLKFCLTIVAPSIINNNFKSKCNSILTILLRSKMFLNDNVLSSFEGKCGNGPGPSLVMTGRVQGFWRLGNFPSPPRKVYNLYLSASSFEKILGLKLLGFVKSWYRCNSKKIL